jgi:hypothetical protein
MGWDGADWNHLVQCRDKSCKHGIKPSGSIKCGNYLACWVTINTLLHEWVGQNTTLSVLHICPVNSIPFLINKKVCICSCTLSESPAYKESNITPTRPIKKMTWEEGSLNILLQWNQAANVTQYCVVQQPKELDLVNDWQSLANVMVQCYKILININLRHHCCTTVTSQNTRPVSSKCFESDNVIHLSSVNARYEVPDEGKTAP